MSLSPVNGVGAVSSAPTPTGDVQLPDDSLLPEPAASVTMDSMSELYAVMSEQRRVSTEGGKGNAEALLESKKMMRARALEQVKKAEDDEEKGGMFGKLGKTLGTVGKIAAIVGAAALVVATGGAGLVGVLAISAVVLSSAAFAQSETRFLQHLGMDDKAAGYTELGLMGASAACSGGAGIAAATGAGASAAGAASEAATTFEKGALLVGAGASIVAGTCTSASAYAGWQKGEYEADAQQHMASAALANAKAAMLERTLTALIDQIEDSDKSDQRTLGHVRSAMEAKGAAVLMASTTRV